MAYIRAAQAGNYSDPATWEGGVVPSTGDIACSGSYRITIDQNVLAIISAANADWVTAGGSTLATTHTGGFTLQAESNFSIAGMNYEVYRTTTPSTSNCDLVAANASFTITGLVSCVSNVSNTTASAAIHIAPTNASNVYTYNFNGDIYLLSSATTRSSMLINVVNTANSSKYAINFYGAILAANNSTYAGHSLIISNTATPVSVDITFHSSIITNALIYLPFNAVPVGTANLTFKNKYISQGTFSISNSSTLSNFKNILFEQGICLTDDVGVTAPFTFTASTLIRSIGNIEIINAAKTYLTFQGTAAIVIDGDIIRNPNYTADTGIAVQFNNSSTVTVNGIIRELASVQTAAGTATNNRLVAILSNVTAFTCLGIVGVGFCNPALHVSAANVALVVTINGNVDYSQANSNAVNIRAICLSTTSVTLLITGNVYAATQGSTIFYDQGTIHADTNFNSLSIEGTVYGSNRTPGIAITNGVTAINTLFVNKLVASNDNTGTAYPVPAGFSAIVPFTVNELVCGQTGRFPINGQFFFKDTSTAVIKCRDSTGAENLLVEQTNNVIPSVNDIREGVSIGGSAGTLVIPSKENVKSGIVYGNGLVGELDLGNYDLKLTEILKAVQGKDFSTYLLDTHWDQVTLHLNSDNYQVIRGGSSNIINESTSLVLNNDISFRNTKAITIPTQGKLYADLTTDSFSILPLQTDFTIEMHVKAQNVSVGAVLGMIVSLNDNFNLELREDQYLGLWLYNQGGASSTYSTSAGLFPTNVWNHIALVKKGNTYSVFLNGAAIISTTSTVSGLSANRLCLFTAPWDFSKRLVGVFQDLVITKFARYEAPFVPNKLPYPYTQFDTASTVTNPLAIKTELEKVKQETNLIKTLLL